MKKTLLSIGTAMAVMSMNAQVPYSVPNAGFESWITTGSQAGKAQSWSGYGDIGLLLGLPSYTMLTTYFKDGSVKHSGSYSMRIQNTQITPTLNFEGIAWLGTAGTTSANAGIYGIPFTQSITASGAWARYTINAPATSNKDTAVIFFQTTKWTGTTKILVQDASILITSNTTGFQNFTQAAFTVNNAVPDTLWIIALSSFNDADQNYDNLSNLWIDDLTLTVAAGITAPVLNFVDTRFAPNPASDEVRFTTSALNIGGALKLYDALGKEVLTVPVTSALDNRFSVEALPAGIYFYQIHSTSGEINAQGKLVVTK
jgi:hypothetical protein